MHVFKDRRNVPHKKKIRLENDRVIFSKLNFRQIYVGLISEKIRHSPQ